MIRLQLVIIISLFFVSLTISHGQELEPEITLNKKKLIILTNENNKISEKIYQIASSAATQLKRYDVMDRNQLKEILEEQKLQHSGVVDPDQAIELGKVAAANEALLIKIQMFGQKGIPTEKHGDDDEDEPKSKFIGWIIKEVVKAGIEKATEDIERYPNNIQTIIDCEIHLINVETGQSIDSFDIHAEYIGGTKSKSLSQALKQVRSKMTNNLKQLYQLSSEVLEVRGKNITLFLGKNMGVNSKSIFEIISRDQRKILRNREITIPGESVGFVKIETVSNDASKGVVLRKWDDMEPGFQAHEITEGLFTGGISGVYGNTPRCMRLRLLAQIKPFNRFGGEIHGDIGITQDTRGRDDFQFGFGGSLHLRLIKTSSFSLGPTLSIPIDFHTRRDDENDEGKSHWVFLPMISPRLGIQTEIMLSPKVDLLIRGEYVLSSVSSNHWTYSEEQDDEGENESTTWNAHWDAGQGPIPEINYEGWMITLGIRKISFSSFTFN